MQKLLENYLDNDQGANKVLAHARQLIKLSNLYQKMLPPHLYQASRVANYNAGVLVVHTGNTALAAKLRQMAPTLIAEFFKQGVPCSELKIKVQTPEHDTSSKGSTQKPLSSKTQKNLSNLSGSLPESPLRGALEHLLARAVIKP
ncbi:MAG: DciA family protein [Pseudomonadota bacterium]